MISGRHRCRLHCTLQHTDHTDTAMEKILQLFKDHPDSVGESYFEHMSASFSFAVPLFSAAIAAFIHGLFPFFFVKTGSSIVTRLHERMVVNRARQADRK